MSRNWLLGSDSSLSGRGYLLVELEDAAERLYLAGERRWRLMRRWPLRLADVPGSGAAVGARGAARAVRLPVGLRAAPAAVAAYRRSVGGRLPGRVRLRLIGGF